MVLAASSTDWGQFHGDSAHNGYSGSSGPVNPKTIWAYSLGGTNNGLMASNGMLIASSVSSGQLLALSESNGSSVRNFGFVTPGWYSPRYVVSTYSASGVGLVFFSTVGSDWYQWSDVTEDGSTFIDSNYLSNGQNVWASGVPSGPTQFYRQWGTLYGSINPYYGLSLIAYYQGDVYAIPFDSGTVTAIQSSSGTIDWQLNLPGLIDTIPTIGNNVIVVGYSDQNKVTGMSARTNTTLWNFTTDGPVDASPAYDNGNFFFGTKGGNFYCVTQNGQEAWSVPIGARIETTPAIAFGLVFLGAYNGTLYALDAETGNEAWKFPVEGGLLSSPVVAANGILYQATTSGLLYALNVTNGAELWTYHLEAGVTASPVLDNGYLFLIDSNGMIYAIANSFSVTFSKAGLPLGTSWGVTLGTETSFSNTNTNAFSMTNGIYAFNISRLDGYTSSPSSGSVTVDGANVSIPVTFSQSWRLPSAPQNLKATGSIGSIVLSWKPPPDSGAPPDFNGSGIEAYYIYRSTTSASEQYYDKVGGSLHSYTDSSVNPNSIYFYEAATVNPVGQSGFSNEAGAMAVFYTVPSAPLNMTALAQGTSIYLAWEPPASNGGTQITEYVLYRGASPESLVAYETPPGNMTQYEDKSFAPSQIYYYEVIAVNNIGQSNPSNIAVVTAPKSSSQIDWWRDPSDYRLWGIIIAIISLVASVTLGPLVKSYIERWLQHRQSRS